MGLDNIELPKTQAEKCVSKFYNTIGWATVEDITEDARRFEDLRENCQEYASKTRLRVLDYIPESGTHLLDMASGPLQYKEYLLYSKNFEKRHCVDFSIAALEAAKKKIGHHGVYLLGNFMRLSMDENFFECAVSLHTIYHIDKDEQEAAVRKLLKVTKPGKPVIIVYSNPNTLWSRISFPYFKRLVQRLKKVPKATFSEKKNRLYYHCYPNEWWYRYRNLAEVKILPWRSFGPHAQRRLIPDNKLGKFLLRILFRLENTFPSFFANNFTYNMIILTKNKIS